MIRFAALTLEEMCDRLGDDKADAPILDGHNHVVLPAERHVALLDEGGVSRAVLLVARPHPERATDLAGFRQEMAALSQTVSGAQNVGDSVRPAMAQLHETISLYPDRFIGFGQVPLSASATNVCAWVQTKIVERGLRGIGEVKYQGCLLSGEPRRNADFKGCVVDIGVVANNVDSGSSFTGKARIHRDYTAGVPLLPQRNPQVRA